MIVPAHRRDRSASALRNGGLSPTMRLGVRIALTAGHDFGLDPRKQQRPWVGVVVSVVVMVLQSRKSSGIDRW
ncbi:hypothetical protein WKW77_31430 [Variovorax ureilyticus]|uniref:Uncharacterized protein n=1 Tax=Variovorax ureilyticus TaxID=1836198 RepID=A0ABU8VR29_9BURK